MASDPPRSPDSDSAEADATGAAAPDVPDGRDPVDARLDDALERVAHGATVSVPSILCQRALTIAFTAVLTNGFAASTYGVFALARRIQAFLLRLALGFGQGLSRFLPTTGSRAERDAIATVAATLLLGVAVAFVAVSGVPHDEPVRQRGAFEVRRQSPRAARSTR